jgi:sterol desaturase/sphingolipid hydroxylase (fatty acid hydroxylase superfamily)
VIPAKGSSAVAKDPTVLAIPFYFGTMGLEYLWLRGRPEETGQLLGYERRDTVTSLAMGVGSLMAPLVFPRLLRGVVPGKGRYGWYLVGLAAGAAAVTTLADQVAKVAARGDDAARDEDAAPGSPAARRRRTRRLARQVASAAGVTAVVAGGTALATSWNARTTMGRMWRRRLLPDLGTGALAHLAAILGWDFIYYWNHRFMHEVRWLWAVHVVHHSSERYNLSTALRQPVSDEFGVFVPYSLLALFGIRPGVVQTARGVNLLYQFWIHTEAIGELGQLESTLNTPSHHRVHHGSNSRYLDRNYGSILISWDRLFGSFEPESERVVYGLTKNIGTFNPWRVATHEYAEILRDVARSDNWRDRLSFALRGPGWAARRREALEAGGRRRRLLDGARSD